MNYFITGTDTGVGKTYAVSLLVHGLRRAGLDSVGMKPVCSGDRSDAELLQTASGGGVELDDINPVWFRTPASPYAASMIENKMIDLAAIRTSFDKLRKAHPSMLVEGVGGWLVPLRRDYFVRDLAAEFGLPVVVVARNRLGALNHTLLTVRAIQLSGQECAGIILNNMDGVADDIVQATTRSMIEELSGVPVLFEIERGQTRIELGIA